MIYLYVKTHNVTGLKYLGKTIKDPYLYKGSGKYWKRHIKKYGYDVTTEILLETNDPLELLDYATQYSIKYNVVDSKEWANLIIESGDGGDTSEYINYNTRNSNLGKKIFYENRKAKYLEKYGVENHSQLPEYREKLKGTCLEKYGVEHVSKIPEVRKKITDNNRSLGSRQIVQDLKDLKKCKDIPDLKKGWYKKSEEFLLEVYNRYK